MKQIGILSDTHGYLDDLLIDHLKSCNEIWHAGDWGTGVAEELEKRTTVKGVFGNIDGQFIRKKYPEFISFSCEDVKVLIIHIGGYPGRYENGVKDLIKKHNPNIFISGHSHILKIMRDEKMNNLLHINPGAAGKSGFHDTRTIVKLKIEGQRIFDVQVIELGKRTG